MAVELTSERIVRADLSLAGYRFISRPEACGHPDCETCSALDTKFMTDILAADSKGRPVFIGYRRQDKPRPGGGPPYDYPTITIRRTTDRGGADTEFRKLLLGKAKFDVFIQSYLSRIMVATRVQLIKACQQPAMLPCRDHVADWLTNGEGGATYLVLCRLCAGIAEIKRSQPLLAVAS